MNQWLEELAELWAVGEPALCQAGHTSHDTKIVNTMFGPLHIFDWAKYAGFDGYCSGQDDVSRTLDLYGRWEPIETLVAQAILTPDMSDESVVLDIGSHIGWFTHIAVAGGYSTLALDGDADHLRVCADTFAGRDVVPVLGWIDGRTSVLSVDPGLRVRFLKSDLEGSEDQVVRICEPLFRSQLVDYALIEVSPVLADHYPETVTTIINYGYAAAIIPSDYYLPLEYVAREDVRARLETVNQCNMLFHLPGEEVPFTMATREEVDET